MHMVITKIILFVLTATIISNHLPDWHWLEGFVVGVFLIIISFDIFSYKE